MEIGRLFFDPTCHGNMLFLGTRDSLHRGPKYGVMNMEETLKRPRPFCSSHDELFEDEYREDPFAEKKRRLTPEQVHMLEKSFEMDNKLEPERKSQLAKDLGLQPRQVAVWFQNRRARWKTKQLERDLNHLKSSYDSLLSDYNSIRNENDMLKAEVASLSEKLKLKEVNGATSDQLPADLSHLSTGSAVLDETGPHLADSGNSYFQTDSNPIAVNLSSEEDGSENSNNQIYFSDTYVVAEQAEEEEKENGGEFVWWVWS